MKTLTLLGITAGLSLLMCFIDVLFVHKHTTGWENASLWTKIWLMPFFLVVGIALVWFLWWLVRLIINAVKL